MRVSWQWLVVGILIAGGASAQSRWAVVGSGNCSDPDLLNNVRQLWNEMRSRVGNKLLTEEKLREKLAPATTRTPEELSRQFQAVQMLFYQNKLDEAEEQVRGLVVEVSRLPAGKERWKLQTDTHLLRAMILRELKHDELANQEMAWVLRRDPNYPLDKRQYSGQTHERFERVRKQVAQEKRIRLEVKSQPSGADVFLDSLLVGKTPFQVDLPVASASANASQENEASENRYQVVVMKDGATSMPHLVTLKAPVSLYVDLQFEGAIHTERTPCLSYEGDEKTRWSNAQKLATLLEVEQMAVLRVEHQNQGSLWLVASVLEAKHSSARTREGSLKVTDPSRASEELGGVADFILTGLSRGSITTTVPSSAEDAPSESSKAAGTATPAKPGAGSAPSRSTGTPPAAAPVRPPSGPATEVIPALNRQGIANPEASNRTWRTPVGLGVAGVGLVGVGIGVFAQLNASHLWEQFNGYYANGTAPSQLSLPTVVQMRQSAQTAQGVAMTGFIAGGVALVGGAALLLLDGAPPSTPVAVRLVASPTSLGVNVRFP